MNIMIKQFSVTLKSDDSQISRAMKMDVGGGATVWTPGKAYEVLAIVDQAGIPNFMLADDNGLIRVINIGWTRYVRPLPEKVPVPMNALTSDQILVSQDDAHHDPVSDGID